MILSMTGYGQGEYVSGDLHVVAEARSFNSRFLDIVVRLPKHLSTLEQRVRDVVRKYAERGHVNITIKIRNGEDKAPVLRVDLPTARAYARLLNELKSELDLAGGVTLDHLLNFPDVITAEGVEEEIEGMWEPIAEAVARAMESLREMRRQEGIALEKDLRERVERLEAVVKEIEKIAEERREEQFRKLKERVRQLLEDEQIDIERLNTELALIVDRMDVTEECVRFHSHNEQFLKALEADEPVGRRLNFLLQEMNREATTIGSKAYSAEISHRVVQLKEEIEKIREQVQNIE